MSTEWLEPVAGFTYREDVIEVSAAHQAEKHGACGIDTLVFDNFVDPAFFIGIAIHAGIRSGISAEGNVNMLQSLIQHRPALLGEALTVRGEISAVNEVPRGRTLHTNVDFFDAAGQKVITANRVSLKPDPSKSSRGAGERPPPIISDPGKLKQGASYQLTPNAVVAYSNEGNAIHYEQDAAEKAGFRAPIIGGGMGVHYLMAHLFSEVHNAGSLSASARPDLQSSAANPNNFSMDIYFRRPIFWDEKITVVSDGGGGADGASTLRALGLLKADGRVGTELRLHFN